MQLTEAEWRLMQVLWDASPGSARDVHGGVADATGWAYTTVKTMLDRLVEKGALRSRMQGKQSLYTPLVTRKKARASAVRSLIQRAFDGEVGRLFAHMVDDDALTAKERAELEALLAKIERKAKP